MAIKKFTNEEKEMLKSNKYSHNVTNNSIRFTAEFKQLFYKKIVEGASPRDIVVELGYDLDILGVKRAYGIALHIKDEYRLNGEFHNGRRLSSLQEKLENNEITPSKALLQIQTKISYLEQQVEYLKKILVKEK